MPAKVFEHFEMPPDPTGLIKVKCKHCTSVISGRIETTSNFVTHMKVCTKVTVLHIYAMVAIIMMAQMWCLIHFVTSHLGLQNAFQPKAISEEITTFNWEYIA